MSIPSNNAKGGKSKKISQYRGNHQDSCDRKGKWVTVHKTRDIYIRHSRVPLPEIYSSLSEAFHKAYTNETAEAPGVEAVPAPGGVEVCWIAVLPRPGNLGSWLGFERNS